MSIAGPVYDVRSGFRRVSFGCMSGVLAVLSFAGCGSSAPVGTVPVSGTVKFDGAPLEGALVTFMTDDDVRAAKTDKDGHFQFTAGAKPLKYRVVISKFDGAGDVVFDSDLGMDEGQVMAMEMSDPTGQNTTKIAQQLIPEKYSSKTASELSITVPLTGTQEANFDLTK